MPLFRARHSSLVGLDINPDEIRLLQLNHHQGQWSVENVASIELPAQAIVDGHIKQFDLVQEGLSSLVRNTKTRGAPAAIALPATLVMTQRIKLAAELTADECEAEISENLARYLPITAEELCFDFVNLPVIESTTQEILLIASRQEPLNTYVRLVSAAGLKLRLVDVDSYALLRAVSLSLATVADEIVAVIDVNDGMSRFMVFQTQHIIFSHYWEAADLTQLEGAVERAMTLFKAAHKQCVIHQVILSGRIAGWQHSLAHYFQTTLAVTPQVSNPFGNMRIAAGVNLSPDLAARMQICCGLAMRSA
jgi:type IV pilus assembly protein PilM